MGCAEWISEIKYKPGWEFTHQFKEWGHVMDIHATVPHAVTLEPMTFLFSRVIPIGVESDEALFLKWAKAILVEAEVHELDEFFRFRGELVNDPHKPVVTV